MDKLYDVYRANELGWDAVGLLLVLLILAWLSQFSNSDWLNSIPRRRGKTMRRARRNYIRSDFIDGAVHYIEERVYDNVYSREEAKEIYRDLKKCFPVRDFFPSPELLKENIRRRIASGTHAPVALPDKKEVKNSFSKFAKPVT